MLCIVNTSAVFLCAVTCYRSNSNPQYITNLTELGYYICYEVYEEPLCALHKGMDVLEDQLYVYNTHSINVVPMCILSL